MESLLRAVLTSPPADLPVQQNISTQVTSPYLHAALTTALHQDPRTEQSRVPAAAAEQATAPPTAAGSSGGGALGERESKQIAGEGVETVAVCGDSGVNCKKPSSLISNRHSKLLEALTSDFRLSKSRLRAALTTPLLSPLPTSLTITPPPAPQPQLTTNSQGSSADPNPQSNAAPYKSKLFLALTSPLEHWDKDLACSKEPNSISDSNKTHCPGKTTRDQTIATKAVGKTIKQENTTEPISASPAEIEPKTTPTTTTTEVTGKQHCYQCSSDAIKSELSVPTECLLPSFQSANKNNATPYHSELHNTVFHESPGCTKSQSALVDRLHASPVCSFVDSHHESKKREMQSCSLGNGKRFGFSPETATCFDQKIKTESTRLEMGQSSLEHKQTPTCAVKTLPNVALVSHNKHDKNSTVCVNMSEGRQLCKEEFGRPYDNQNFVNIENTEQSGKSNVCVAVPVEKQLSEEEVIPHNGKDVVKISHKMKRMHFRKKLLNRSKSPSRPSGISVAKKRKFLEHCKSRLENSDPFFGMDSPSSLLEHVVCKKQKVEDMTKRNLEKDEGSSSSFDNQIITDSSSGESMENSVSGSVKNHDNPIDHNGVSSCMMLQENLTENFSECQRKYISQSRIKEPKLDVKSSCDSKLGSEKNYSSPSRPLWEKNTGYPNNNSPATKSLILREALISAPISLHNPSSGLAPVPEFEKMNGMTTDSCDSVANNHSGSRGVFLTKEQDQNKCTVANNHSGSRGVFLTKEQDQNKCTVANNHSGSRGVFLTKEQDQNKCTVACKTPSATVTASEKICKPAGSAKHSSQLLLAALTAADDLRKTPVSKPITRQTNSEILRAALDSSEKADSLNYHSKHSQLLRAALIAVDTNKAIKENTHEIGPKNSNSRLLRAVLTGKYSPETDRFCHSKTSSSPPLPSPRPLSVASMPLTGSKNTSGVKNVSQDTTKSSVNTGSSRASGHSILRAVLTGALDVPQRSVTNSFKSSVPQVRRHSRRRRRRSELVLKPNHGGYFRNDDCDQSQTTTALTSAETVNDNPKKTEQPGELNNEETHYKTEHLQDTESCVGQHEKPGDECIYCGRVHSSDDTLWLYTSLFASEKQHHFCHVCRQTFSITCLFLRHVEQHSDAQTKYRCEFCGRYFVHVLSYIMCRLSHLDAEEKEKGKANSNGGDKPLECRVKCENNLDVQKKSSESNNNNNINNNINNNDDNKTNGFYILPNKDNYKDDNEDNYKYGKKNSEDDVKTDGRCRGGSGDCKLCKKGLFQRRLNCFLHETDAAVDDDDDDDDDDDYTARSDVSCEGCTENCSFHYEPNHHHHPRDQIHNTTTPTPTTKDNHHHHHNNNNNNNNNCCNGKKTFQCTACTKWFLTRKELCIHEQLHLDIPAGERHHHQEKINTPAFQSDPDAHQQCAAPVLTKMHLGCNSCGALQQSRRKYRTPCLWNNCSGDTAAQLHSDSRCLQLVKD